MAARRVATEIVLEDVQSSFYKEKLRQVANEIKEAEHFYEEFKERVDALEWRKRRGFVSARDMLTLDKARQGLTHWHFRLVQLYGRKLMIEEGYRRWYSNASRRAVQMPRKVDMTVVMDKDGRILYDPNDSQYDTEEDE